METTLLGILASLFAGVNIFQLLFIRSQRKKAGAEASKVSAEAYQEEAKGDGLSLNNIKNYNDMRDDLLIKTEKRNHELQDQNDSLTQKLRDYDRKLEDFERDNDYKLKEFERKIQGMQKTISHEIARRTYAENNICLNLPCKDRIPKIGTYNHKNDETKTA